MGSPWVVFEHFVLIGAMNPCPCGYYGDPVQECTCSNAMVTRYQKRVPSFHSGQARGHCWTAPVLGTG
jgi:predicted ATPase with chaperone activity